MTKNQLGDFVKLCGLLRKPVLYQLGNICFSFQYNPNTIIFFRRDLILSTICTSAMHILPRQRAVKWCVVHLPMQNKFVVCSSHSISQETCVSASTLFLHSLQWCQHTWQAMIDFYSLFYIKLNCLLPKAVTGNHQIVFEILICIRAE